MASLFQVLAMLLPFFLCQEKSEAQLTILSKPTDVVYVEVGKTLRLNLTFNYTGDITFLTVSWSFNSKTLVLKSGNSEPRSSLPGRATIEGQASFVLNKTTSKDNGKYTFHWIGANSGDLPFTVIIQVQPTAVINCNSSSPVPVKEGDKFECLCNSTGGNPPPTASWYKDGNLVSGPRYLNDTLSLKNITGNDTGNYSCFVESRNLQDTRSVEIEVLLKPIAMTNCSTSVTVKEGDDLECLCYDTRGNPSSRALWYKVGKKILSFKSISIENAGNYSCLVNNTVFEDEKKIKIHVQYKPINIVLKIADQNKYNVILGENVTITCKAKGLPAPDYIIFHNGTSLTNVVNGMTTIKSINYSDGGQYKCIARNIVGNVSASFNLIVQERPTAEINCSSPVTVKEGDNFVCLCYSSTGHPSPNATWYNSDGNKVGKTESLKKTLLLKNIMKEEAGNYSCIVKSLDLNDTKQVKLQVQYKPIIKNFTSGLENNNATIGQNLSIKCVADGFPKPNIVIFHGDTKLTGVVNGMKTIMSVSYTHAGRYECMVNNSLGNMSASFKLTVEVKVSTTTPNPTEEVSTPTPSRTKVNVSTPTPSSTKAPPEETSKLNNGVIAGIAVGCGFFFILVVVLICYCCCKHDKCVVCCCCCKHMICGACCRSNSKKERNESELVLADGGIAHVSVVVEEDSKVVLPDGGIANVSVVAKEDFNAYETVDKEKIKPNEEAGTSGDGEPARVDSPPSMPPVYAVVDKKSIKKKSPADEEKPASGEDGNDVPAPGPVYAAVDKVAQKKQRDAKPDFLTYACLDPVLLQPDSSKMRDRSREESNYADIDMAKLHTDKA